MRLIECLTPSTKKTFVLYIPEKFTMKPPEGKEFVSIMYEENGVHEEFLELVGDTPACGISGDKIIMGIGGKMLYYRFGEHEVVEEDVGIVEELAREAENSWGRH